jgi:hypothetical protein
VLRVIVVHDGQRVADGAGGDDAQVLLCGCAAQVQRSGGMQHLALIRGFAAAARLWIQTI